MSLISLSNPTEVLLFDDTLLRVNNLDAPSKQISNFGQSNSIGYFEVFENNQYFESGTILHQFLSDINLDSNPPKVSISGVTIADQDNLITLETFFERPRSSITISNKRYSFGLPSINFSGAFFSEFSGNNLIVQQNVIGSDPLEKFPESGKILLNKEVISYTGKTGTSLNNINRSQDGTILDTHVFGDYLRTISI